MRQPSAYNCSHYREEMILLGLRRRLEDPALPPDEKRVVAEQIRQLEHRMGME